MTVIKSEVRTGVYYDSAFLMQLQRTISDFAGVEDAGVIMGTDANKELLAHINLVSPEVQSAKPDDLVVVVRADNDKVATFALAQVEDLLKKKKTASDSVISPQEHRICRRKSSGSKLGSDFCGWTLCRHSS